ncbi:MAG: protein-export membrane protein SecD [Elusimicrobia bacterium RIFOXYC2_FULL_34_12]|nr:MAG: protein-export membrane protein SecD [Elusimicrobia bacterium RIFOXYC2_FULL_34_12]OGS38883.1 MAG: protein-export membrane protein SecD [Elusimicrobia bacterium RIFOXYD2_FULL_34_30]HAM39044.1 protein translocase subunit SecD [Elusimicrobiota bacterium]
MDLKKFKWLIFWAVLLGSIYVLWPTFLWYRMTPEEKLKAQQTKEKIVNKILNLGLDLQGGIHLVLEIDDTKIEKDTNIQDALTRAIEIIRNRIDQFGVSEPFIAKQGEKWIVVQLPGIKDPKAAIDLIGKTALLEFRLVDDTGAIEKVLAKAREMGIQLNNVYDENNKPKKEFVDLIPKGYTILPGKEEGYFLVTTTSQITGAYLTDAKMKIGGQYNMPYVGLDFNPDGARIFASVTGANIDKRLAIVLDGIVQSAPVIRSRIPDGHAIIEGNFSAEEASGLAIVLRAGALPAPVRIIENRTVGPSLGRDSVKAGLVACLVGLLLVVSYMFFYYKTSGLIANSALILNLVVLLGMMAIFHATLTLPGIAGIILTIGMAVDANVLILERIREEIRNGKTVRVSIDLGYEKAFSAIIDSNLTTLIAAAFLFQFGTGPIKGFAVTLTLGIITSMYTSIIVTHQIYDVWLSGRQVEKLSI